MGKYFDMVRQRAIEKRKSLEQDPSATEEDFSCMKIAEKFLSHKAGFAVSQPIMSLVVLKFLGYSDTEIKDLYYKLVYEQSTQDQYRYVNQDQLENSLSDKNQQPPHIREEEPEENPNEESEAEKRTSEKPIREESPVPRLGRLIYRENGKLCQTDLLPLIPRCETYYYTKYCFGKKDANGRLYTLVGNEWRYGGQFMSYYFDAQYDYWEVDYILEPNSTIP